jgi:hypothetical protein
VTENNGFILFGDVINLQEELQEIQIIPGYILKKANSNQMEIIKRNLTETGNRDFFMLNFETEKQEIDGVIHYLNLPDYKDWNYWIIEHNESQFKYNLKLALQLSKCDLFCLFEILSSTGRIHHQFAYHNFISENIGSYNIKRITLEDIMEIREIYGLLEDFSYEAFTYIDKALKDYSQLKTMPSRYSFYILGMFSIIEALLVHKSQVVPITHQIKTKLSLLNNRFDHPINFQEFFGEVRYEKVISKLYEFRSDIAHGDFSDFNNELKLLVDSKNVSKVIHRILKSTLIQALKEPQLISDLKKC